VDGEISDKADFPAGQMEVREVKGWKMQPSNPW